MPEQGNSSDQVRIQGGIMTLSLTCNSCNEAITGADEDELVARVQAHVREHSRLHGVSHTLSRDQVLARLRRQQAKESSQKE